MERKNSTLRDVNAETSRGYSYQPVMAAAPHVSPFNLMMGSDYRRYILPAAYETASKPWVRPRSQVETSDNIEQQERERFNSQGLRMRLMGDVLVASGVTFAISPFTSIVDKAIVEQAAGKHSVASSVLLSLSTMIKDPITFLKSPTFLLMWSVYAATYTTANCLKTGMEYQEANAIRRRESARGENYKDSPSTSALQINKFNVFVATTAVNSGFSILRDKIYAQMFGNKSSGGGTMKVPLKTYGLWGLRDGVVIASSFVLPDIVGKSLQESCGMNKADALKVAQMGCPIASQFVAGPAQLLGLDYYNRPQATFGERISSVAKNFTTVVAARIARIAPTYGIGGISNTHFRNEWREYLIRRNVKQAIKVQEQSLDEQRRSAAALVDLVRAGEMKSSKNNGSVPGWLRDL